MSTENKPMTYLCMKSVVPHMAASQRIPLSLGSPVVKSICEKFPLHIETLRVDEGDVDIDGDTYRFTRLMSSRPTAETEFVQFTVNNENPRIIRTKTPVEEIVMVFLEVMLGGRQVHVDNWAIGCCSISNISLHVKNVEFIGQYCGTVLENMISRDSFPLESVEIANWEDVPTHVNTEVLIAPYNCGNWAPILDSTNHRIHLKSQPPEHREAHQFVRNLIRKWELVLAHAEGHWSFDVSTDFYAKFMKCIHRPGRFGMEIRNGQYRLTCERNEDTCLYVQTVRNKETPDTIILHLVFVDFDEI